MEPRRKPIPVILDTDIGGDIDDTWALALLLRSPELDVRLVVSDTGNTEYRAALLARLLEVGGRTDVPVGVDIKQPTEYLGVEPMRLRVTDDGFTVPDNEGAQVNVALRWTDLPGFEAELVRRLASVQRQRRRDPAEGDLTVSAHVWCCLQKFLVA